MNAKKCKNLRRQALFINDKSTTYNTTVSKTINHVVPVLDSKGNVTGETTIHQEHKFIRTLGDCTRKTYQALKRIQHAH